MWGIYEIAISGVRACERRFLIGDLIGPRNGRHRKQYGFFTNHVTVGHVYAVSVVVVSTKVWVVVLLINFSPHSYCALLSKG